MGVGICLANLPHSLQWSPFQSNLLGISCSNRPGHTPISGILYTIEFLPQNQLEIRNQIQFNIGLRMMRWSHKNENIVLVTCDDFKMRLLDLANQKDCLMQEFPFIPETTTRGLFSILDWDSISGELILTSQNDKAYILNSTQHYSSQSQYETYSHEQQVLDAQWNSHSPFHFLSCDVSGFVYFWDTRQKQNSKAIRFAMANNTSCIKLDLNRFDEYSLVTAGLDHSIYTYDLRYTKVPKGFLKDVHYSSIRDVKWSPHTQHILASCSSDRTIRIWDMRESSTFYERVQQQGMVETTSMIQSYGGKASLSLKSQKLEDWVNALDWNLHEVGLVALCCNDHLVKAYNVREE